MQAIRTRYYGPTDTRGSCIVAKCEGGSVRMPYAHELNISGNHRVACETLMRKLRWTSDHGNYTNMIGGQFGHDYYWVFKHEEDHGNVTAIEVRS